MNDFLRVLRARLRLLAGIGTIVDYWVVTPRSEYMSDEDEEET